MNMFFEREVKKYDRMEFSGISGDVKISIVRPDGKIDEVHPFIYQPVRFEYDFHGYESICDDGEK